MTKLCTHVEAHLIEFVERRVAESLREKIENHLENCSDCARLLKRFALIWDELAGREQLDPPESIWPALYSKIQLHEQAPHPDKNILPGVLNLLRPAAVAVLFLCAILFGIHLGNRPVSAPEIPSPDDAHPEWGSEMYVAEYLKDFQDFPSGSMGDIYTRYEIQNPDEKP